MVSIHGRACKLKYDRTIVVRFFARHLQLEVHVVMRVWLLALLLHDTAMDDHYTFTFVCVHSQNIWSLINTLANILFLGY